MLSRQKLKDPHGSYREGLFYSGYTKNS